MSRQAGPHDYPAEAHAIYRVLFGGEPPALLVERYTRAAQALDSSADWRELAAVHDLLAREANLEAAELAGRLTGRLALLTRKFAAMSFLAETLPDHQRFFVQRHSDRTAAAAALAASAAVSAGRLAQGLWLLRGLRRG